MHFEIPWLWLLAVPLIVFAAWMSRRSYAQLEPWARRASLGLRIAALLLLLGALAQPVLEHDAQRRHAVFLLDVSKSISAENLEAGMRAIDKLARDAVDAGARVSVICFGERPKLVIPPSETWNSFDEPLRERVLYETTLPELYAQRTEAISSGGESEARTDLEDRIEAAERFRDEVAGELTDVEEAMRLALNAGALNESRTVCILTDANFNQGRWSAACTAAEQAQTAVHIAALDRPAPPEVVAADLIVPRSVRVNQGFTAEARLASSVETDAELVVFKDGFADSRMNVHLTPGENIFKLPGLYFFEKGMHTVEVTVRPREDTQVRNNTIRALVSIPGETRVLYVDSDEAQMPYLQSALEIEGMQVDARPAAGVPQSLSELLSYDAFILSNVPSDRLSRRQMQMIRTYVQDFGGGFIMLGGDESFGLGGYFNTPIEEILPVQMPIKKDLTRPSLAIVLVIDKSGSMSGVKIQLAKRAAIATAEAINPRDQIGVIGFDGQSRVILELTNAGDRATITGHIASLDAGGGTFLYPALEDAYNRLNQSNARRKHVIVLSDGQTQGFGYENLVGQMAADGITSSTVGIGDGADMRLMESIAMAGGGRAYFTNDFHTIPQIFTREALRASKNMLVEGLVQPIALASDVALKEIDAEALPLLMGYVATTPKEAADTIIVSGQGDPIFARWRYGLGRTAAFTSDTKPRWAEDWIQWPDFAKFWSQLVRSIAGDNLAEEIAIDIEHRRDGSSVLLRADVRNSQGDFVTDVDLEVATPSRSGALEALDVEQTGPGLFEASVPRIRFGEDQQFAFHLAARDDSNAALDDVPPTPYAFVYSYSPEYQTLGVDHETLEALAARTSGSIHSVEAIELHLASGTHPDRVHLWPVFLIIGLLLAPFDILVRRLG